MSIRYDLIKCCWMLVVAGVGLLGLSCQRDATTDAVDAKGNTVDVEIESVKEMNLLPDAAEYGIDVSHHNGKIDWERVKETPLLFVYVKATEGATYVDNRYKENFRSAKKAGYKVGSYHFFRMTSSAHDQFANFKKTVDREKQDLIPMVDVETSDKYSAKELRDSLNVFIGLVREYYGVRPMIYATNRSYNELCGGLYPSYHLYIGRYGDNPPVIKGSGQYSIWQYTEKGRIEGIPKPVDMARFNPIYSIKDVEYGHR